MALNPATNKQIPDNAILDRFNKQSYLGNEWGFCLGNTQITTTSEFPLLLLSNPAVSGDGFPAGYKALFQNIRKLTTITASQSAVLRFYLSPTVTVAGSVQTQVNIRPASLNASVAVVTLNPTVSANGSLVDSLGSNAVSTVSSIDPLLILDPGQKLLVTVQTSSNTTFVAVNLNWFEL